MEKDTLSLLTKPSDLYILFSQIVLLFMVIFYLIFLLRFNFDTLKL